MEKVSEYNALIRIVMDNIADDAVKFANEADPRDIDSFWDLGEWLESRMRDSTLGGNEKLREARSILMRKVMSLRKINGPVYVDRGGRLMLATPIPVTFKGTFPELGGIFRLECKFVTKDGAASKEYSPLKMIEMEALDKITDIKDWEWIVKKRDRFSLVNKGDWERKDRVKE